MSTKIYVLMDHTQEGLHAASLETLALGQRLSSERGASLHALLLGDGSLSLSSQVAAYRVDSVLEIVDPKLGEYNPDSYTQALAEVLRQDAPQLLLMAHIYQNIDLAPKLAAALNTGLVTDSIGYELDGDSLVFIRQMFRNKLNAKVRIHSEPPWIVTLQSGSASADDLEAGQAEVVQRPVDLSSVELRRQSRDSFEAIKGKVDLSKAEIIVAVGRGIKKQENLKIVEELAEALGAEIGASRPVVDNEWLGRDRQIGSSGQTVAPRLYIGCGISGAIQHMVGMKGSGCIVAINTDPHAPIFNVAHYGIVGDLFEVVPALTRKLREG